MYLYGSNSVIIRVTRPANYLQLKAFHAVARTKQSPSVERPLTSGSTAYVLSNNSNSHQGLELALQVGISLTMKTLKNNKIHVGVDTGKSLLDIFARPRRSARWTVFFKNQQNGLTFLFLFSIGYVQGPR